MSSRDNQRLPARQELIMQNRSHRTERNPLIEYIFKLNIAARNSIANNNKIRPRIKIRLRVRLANRNAETREQVAHRRVRSRIGPCDAMPLKLQHARKRGHRRTADPDEMNVFASLHNRKTQT